MTSSRAPRGWVRRHEEPAAPAGSPVDPVVIAANHDPRGTWDPMVDYAMMAATFGAS